MGKRAPEPGDEGSGKNDQPETGKEKVDPFFLTKVQKEKARPQGRPLGNFTRPVERGPGGARGEADD